MGAEMRRSPFDLPNGQADATEMWHSTGMDSACRCSRDAARGAYFQVYRPGEAHVILHAWAGQACVAEVRGSVKLLECADQMCHMPFCMHGQRRLVLQRCGAVLQIFECTDQMCRMPFYTYGQRRLVLAVMWRSFANFQVQ